MGETLQSGKPVTRAMIFKESKLKRPEGEEDIGKTYIEIDMSRQTLYYYVEGDLYLESPIVTGNLKRGRGTPARVCYIYGKQRRRILRGPGYASFVNYWMPVNGNIGLHDATWRQKSLTARGHDASVRLFRYSEALIRLWLQP